MAGELLAQANDAYEASGGPTADKKIANVLTGLGFSLAQYDKKCSEFSGGWQVNRLDHAVSDQEVNRLDHAVSDQDLESIIGVFGTPISAMSLMFSSNIGFRVKE
jgi:hypothetical protein